MRFLLVFAVGLAWPPSSSRAQDAPPAEAGDESDSDSTEGEDYDPRQMRTEGLDDEAARSRFRVGQALYNEGRFLEAAREFESSYELSNRASLLFNAYLSYRDAGRLDDSVRVLERYLGANPQVDDADRLRQRLAAMRVQLQEQQAEDQAAREERERLEREQEQLRLERERAERDAELARQRAREAEAGPNPIGWVVGGVGVGLLAAAGVTGGISRGRVSEIEDNCPNDRCVLSFNLESKRDKADRTILTTDILLFSGIAVTAVGIGLLFLRPSQDDDSDAPEVSFGCGSTGCSAEMRVGF